MLHSSSQSSLTTSSETPTKISIACTLCNKSFKNCTCRNCSVCQRVFAKLAIGVRSHCRLCHGPICKSCLAAHGSLVKICLNCKEADDRHHETTRVALRDITKSKHGIDLPLQFDCPRASGFCEELMGAAKRGDHHILVTLLEKGVDPNLKDSDNNTALILAAKNGKYPCVLLLLEHKADANLANNLGWTPLHAIAWKGDSDEHLECADILIRTGKANPIANTKSNETPYQLAVRMGLKNESITRYFREKELECYRQLLENVIEGNSPGTRIDDLKRPIRFVLEQLEDLIREKQDIQMESSTRGNTPILDRSVSSLASYPGAVTSQDLETGEKLKNLKRDNQKLMYSLSQKVGEIDRIKQKLRKQEETHLLDTQRLRTAQENQVAKLRSDCETIIQQYKHLSEEKQTDFDELQTSVLKHKLVWVQDSLVSNCMNSKCLSPFDSKNRRHHCRCCGRVFCQSCSSNTAPIPCIGYHKPVRVCKICFALLEVIFIEVSATENTFTMDAISLYNNTNGRDSPSEFSRSVI
ncbi:Lateral signaling target protein 2 [Oopsacas minuta]|uniref:Lateral signaling target protein 2 n=1 Tax=Oopsacas minuta TaxID=111878 RepID=A0AAV7K6L3_9METZ|nr:Lateral signaling target protein 2 [Oopsacas minuta]